MPAAAQDFIIKQGDTWSRPLTWKSPDSGGVYHPVDLTGYSARMQIRLSTAAPVIKELSTANGGITLGGAAGTLDLLLTATETAALDFTGAPSGVVEEAKAIGRGLIAEYDLELTIGTVVFTLASGKICLVKDITHV